MLVGYRKKFGSVTEDWAGKLMTNVEFWMIDGPVLMTWIDRSAWSPKEAEPSTTGTYESNTTQMQDCLVKKLVWQHSDVKFVHYVTASRLTWPNIYTNFHLNYHLPLSTAYEAHYSKLDKPNPSIRTNHREYFSWSIQSTIYFTYYCRILVYSTGSSEPTKKKKEMA